MIKRKEIRQELLTYFTSGLDFSDGAFTSEDKGSIEVLLNHIIKALSLPSRYNLRENERATGKASTEARKALRSQVTQEVGQMKREGLIKRITWGRYRPLG
jgi:hypothetical protein